MVFSVQRASIDTESSTDTFCRIGMETTSATVCDLRQSRRDADIRRRIARLALHPMRTLCRGRTALIAVTPVHAASAPDDASAPEDASAEYGSADEPQAAAAGADGTSELGGSTFIPVEARRAIFITRPATVPQRTISKKQNGER